MTNGELIAVKIVTLQRANLMTFRVIGSQRKVAKLVETGNLGYVRTLVSTLLKLTNPVHFLAKKENKDLYSAEPRKCVCDHKSLLESVGEIFQENLLLGFYELVIKVMKSLYFFFSSSLQRSRGDHVATTIPTSRSEKPSVQTHPCPHLQFRYNFRKAVCFLPEKFFSVLSQTKVIFAVLKG